MNRIFHSLIWAATIITAAIVCASQDLSNAAGFGIIAGLSGAALGAIQSGRSCRHGCSL